MRPGRFIFLIFIIRAAYNCEQFIIPNFALFKMNGNAANVVASELKCELHANTLQLFSKFDNQTVLRGRCLGRFRI